VLSFTLEILSPAHFYSVKHQLISKATHPLEPVTPANAHKSDDQSTEVLLSTNTKSFLLPGEWYSRVVSMVMF